MRERAKQNKLFSYIKIPQVLVRLSYKGSKEKNFEDISNISLTVPNLEYHNVTWTWLDLWLAMKNDSKKILLSQVNYLIHQSNDDDKLCSFNFINRL